MCLLIKQTSFFFNKYLFSNIIKPPDYPKEYLLLLNIELC